MAQDSWLNGQRIVLREVQDYLRLGTTSRLLPVFHEHRVFVYRGNILSTSFYWESQSQIRARLAPLDKQFYDAVEEAINRIGHLANFMVIDMAQYTDGHWGVVELNDAVMSGIPSIHPYEMYANLAKYC